MLRTVTAAALAASAILAAAPAHAAMAPPATVDCADSATGSFGYIACRGPIGGNVSPSQTPSVAFDGYGSFDFFVASDDGSRFIGAGSGNSGTLTFAQTLYGPFVLALKGGPTYSLYLFDGGSTGLDSLAFDTLGIAKGNGTAGPGLSHAALFTPGGTLPVPEPGTWALMLAGLASVGWLARRRG
ncbi:MAG: PEPxxWA-CTERM sorting domain-containing protein [Rubrivivax sp.]|jgi:hypothetical protein|nr:PEPxxWA-CTERM sorting domain-containing protein [Rubrivivax sp.]